MAHKLYDVRYENSAMYGKLVVTPEGRRYHPFLTVEEVVDSAQLERLRGFPFVHNLKIVKEYEK